MGVFWRGRALFLIFEDPPVLFFTVAAPFFREGEGREKERERNINMRGKHQLAASCTCPDWGRDPQPRHVPFLGIEPVTFCFMG